MGKKIFVTGAAGFIGFHLALHVAARGDEVIGYDNFNDYYNVPLKRKRAQVLKDQGISIIEGDILNRNILQKSIEEHATTHIVHLAAQAGVRYSLENPYKYLQSNVEGFLNILEICRLHPGIKLTYASSSSVYGANESLPFSIDDRTDHQTSLYGVTKKTNELMAYSYHHMFGIESSGLRFFTVYGPWGRPDMAYFSFASAIAEGRPIQLYNNGNMQRDFTFIDDIIAGSAAAIDEEHRGYQLYNLGNNHSHSLMSLVAELEDALGKKAITHNAPMQQADVIATHADIEHSRKRLGFIPKVTLREGIQRFVAWYEGYGGQGI
jgi:UDP-glucuronate 4-epimerase